MLGKNIIDLTDSAVKILNLARKASHPLDDNAVNDGIQLTRRINSDPLYVPFTPYMMNLIKQTKEDIKYGVKTKLGKLMIPLDAPLLLAEKQIIEEAKAIALQLHGEPKFEYDLKEDNTSTNHYSVDIGRNMLSIGREVTPGASQRRLEQIDDFTKPESKFDAIKKYRQDPDYKGAWHIVYDMFSPTYSATKMKVGDSFGGAGKTNVGYPYFKNDMTVDSKTGKTGGEITLEEAKDGAAEDFSFTASTMFRRDQRAKRDKEKFLLGELAFEPNKARLIQGGDRRKSLITSLVTQPFMEQTKNNPNLGLAIISDQERALQLEKGLKRNVNEQVKVRNTDISKNDTTVHSTEEALAGAIFLDKIIDQEGKEIVLNTIAGLINRKLITPIGLKSIFGTIASGDGGTWLLGTTITLVNGVYIAITSGGANKSQLRDDILSGNLRLAASGDDLISEYHRDITPEQLKIAYQGLNKEVHLSKGEEGFFFLQTRYVFADNKFSGFAVGTRVINGFFGVENLANSLGEFGGTLRSYIKIHDLIGLNNVGLKTIVQGLAKYDKTKFGTIYSLSELMQGIRKESMADNTSHMQKKALWDGDPKRKEFFDANGNVKSEFIQKMYDLISALLQ